MRASNHKPRMRLLTRCQNLLFVAQKAVEECKYRMSRYGVTPNMLIIPPQV